MITSGRFIPRSKGLFLLLVFLVAVGIYVGTTRINVSFFVSVTQKGETFKKEPNIVPETREAQPKATAHANHHSAWMFKWPRENFTDVTKPNSERSLPNKIVSKAVDYDETNPYFRDDSTKNTLSSEEIKLHVNQSESADVELMAKNISQGIPEDNDEYLMYNTTDQETEETEIPVWQLPGNTVFQSIKLRDIEYNGGSFTNENSCPFMGIREMENNTTSQENMSCATRKPSEKECQKSFKAYELHKKPLRCKQEPNELQTDLCWILDSWRPYPEYRLTVQCEISPCGKNPVIVSGIHPDFGTVQPRSTFKFRTASKLEEFLLSFIITNTQYGLNFCFVGCVKSSNRKYSSQILTFPPILQHSVSKSQDDLFNFNILVLDSVSRRHFYRSLPRTVETLRDIVRSDSVNATAFDFELLQSTAPYTFHNIKVFMSGQSAFDYVEHANGSYGISTLYAKLKRRGYYTVLQEDSCWYDEWGSLLTNNVFQRDIPKTRQDFQQRWGHFQHMIRDYYIDDFGLTHSSCEVFKLYKSTNQFNRPRRICFGGTVFAEQFLKYSASVYHGYVDSGKRQPIFSYTHLNLGHEITGTRIRQIDEHLATYLRTMADEDDTLTLIFSDHGPKTTDYSFQTMDGRAEIYDSLLFAIVPEKVANILGTKRIQALVTNQQRLMSTKELHNAIVSIIDPSEGSSRNYPKAGFFAVIPANRTCADISMKTTAVCKCEGWDKRFPDNHPQFLWLAEFALGYLNNLIQANFKSNTSSEGGFGNCQRLVGLKFEKVRRRINGVSYLVTMDLIVQPRNEIFEIQAMYPIHPLGRRDDVRVTSQRRVSIYRRYEKCVDATVPIDLCVCDSKGYRRKLNKKNNWEWFSIKQGSDVLASIIRMRHFGSETTVKNLHKTCLLLLTRKHSSHTSVAFEIANGCGDRRYKVRFNGRGKGRTVTSSKLPISLTVPPRTIHFLFSVYYLEKPHGFYLKTSFVAYISSKH